MLKFHVHNVTSVKAAFFLVIIFSFRSSHWKVIRGGSTTAATPEKEHFVTTVYGWKPLTIITKGSILDIAAVLDVCGDLEKIKKLIFKISQALQENTCAGVSFQ